MARITCRYNSDNVVVIFNVYYYSITPTECNFLNSKPIAVFSYDALPTTGLCLPQLAEASCDLTQYLVTSCVQCYQTGHTIAPINDKEWACGMAHWRIAEMSLMCKFCLHLHCFKTVLIEFANILESWPHDRAWPHGLNDRMANGTSAQTTPDHEYCTTA